MKIYPVFAYHDHSGNPVIEAIFTDKHEAQIHCHKKNVEWAEYLGYWDGSQYQYDLVTKNIPNNDDFDITDCDECGYDCKCNLKKIYKTKEECERYWRKERKEHDYGGCSKEPNCKFCLEDQNYLKRLEMIN